MGISFNCFQEGYNNGFRDALNGKSKNYTGFPKAKAAISGNAYDTYVEGYDRGYLDGMRKKNV
jgi:hypothetical protein